MIEFKATKNPRVALLMGGDIEITFTTSKYSLNDLQSLNNGKELSIQVKDYKPKRSTSQNAYH